MHVSPCFFFFVFFASQHRFILVHNISPQCRICRFAHCPGISTSIPSGFIHSPSFLPLWQKVTWIMDAHQGKWTKEPVGTGRYELCCSLYLFYCCVYSILAAINKHVCPFKNLRENYWNTAYNFIRIHAWFIYTVYYGIIYFNDNQDGKKEVIRIQDIFQMYLYPN